MNVGSLWLLHPRGSLILTVPSQSCDSFMSWKSISKIWPLGIAEAGPGEHCHMHAVLSWTIVPCHHHHHLLMGENPIHSISLLLSTPFSRKRQPGVLTKHQLWGKRRQPRSKSCILALMTTTTLTFWQVSLRSMGRSNTRCHGSVTFHSSVSHHSQKCWSLFTLMFLQCSNIHLLARTLVMQWM